MVRTQLRIDSVTVVSPSVVAEIEAALCYATDFSQHYQLKDECFVEIKCRQADVFKERFPGVVCPYRLPVVEGVLFVPDVPYIVDAVCAQLKIKRAVIDQSRHQTALPSWLADPDWLSRKE
jgi:hypothetical protein